MSKDEVISLGAKKVVDTNEVKNEIAAYIEEKMQGNMKDNLLFLLEALDESKEAYSKACQCFDKSSVSEKRKLLYKIFVIIVSFLMTLIFSFHYAQFFGFCVQGK